MIINRYINGKMILEEDLKSVVLESPVLDQTIQNVRYRINKKKSAVNLNDSDRQESSSIHQSID